MPTAIDRLLELLNKYNNNIVNDGLKAPGEWVANYNKTRIHIVGIPQNISEQYAVSSTYGFINYLVGGGYILLHRVDDYGKKKTVQRLEDFMRLNTTESVLAQIQAAYSPIPELIYLLGFKD